MLGPKVRQFVIQANVGNRDYGLVREQTAGPLALRIGIDAVPSPVGLG